MLAPHEDLPTLSRAWRAFRTRGPRYCWHKLLRRTPGRWTALKRAVVYASPRGYWTLRGGDDYFREQEGQPARTARAAWMAERIAQYRPDSVLEVGCGYGKQLRQLRALLDCEMVGLDFSPTQLEVARKYAEPSDAIAFVLGSGDRLPFADNSFDLVLTSAVILHNRPSIAEAMRREIVRVARRWAAHNEDLDTSYNRFGYDTAAWYHAAGITLAECTPIPGIPDSATSQFCVARVDGW